MPRRAADLTIDLESLSPEEWGTVRAVAEQGGVTPELWPLVDLSNPPTQVLAGLIFVTLKRTEPRITAGRCVRLALAAQGAQNG